MEYIEGDGTAYIDLGFKLTQDDDIEVDFALTTSQSMKYIFGNRGGDASNNNIALFFASTTNKVVVDFNDSDYSLYRAGPSNALTTGVKYSAVLNKNKRGVYNGATTIVENTTVCADTIETAGNAAIFGGFYQNGAIYTANNFKGRIYRVTIAGKHDLRPAKNSSDVVGMYDLVTGQFFVNAGTGSFTAGPNTTPSPENPMGIVTNNGVIKARRQSGLPLGYQMVEWLISTGSIVITGFKTKSTQELETVFYREQSGASYLYSSDTNTSGTTNTTAYLTSGAGNWRWDGKSYSISVSTGIKFTAVHNKGGVWLNGTRTGWYSDAGEFVSTNDLRLSSGENTAVRIYSMTIREGETVTLDLVPVQRLSDSAYGFYDKVSGNFYTNAEATITAGAPIDDPMEIYTDGEDEVLTVSGKNLADPSYMDASSYGTLTLYGVTVDRAKLLSVEVGKTYTLSAKGVASGSFYYYFYKITADGPRTPDYLLINRTTESKAIQGTTTFTAVADEKYYVQFANSVSVQRITFEEFQLEYGSTATAYEPYVAPQTASVPMLLSVGNYKDTAELIQGVKMGKVGIVRLSPDWTWLKSSTYVGSFYTNDVAGAGKKANDPTALCTHGFKVNSLAEYSKAGVGAFYWYSVATMNYKFDDGTATVEQFKQFLTNNAVLVVYPLATETTEQTTAYPQLCNKLYTTADVTAEVDDISVTFTTGTQTVPSPYSQLPIKCNNGTLKWNGTAVVADGTPEVLTVGGKNLFDISSATRYRSSASGNSTTTSTFTADSSSSAAQTYGMAVKPNTTYTVSKTGGNRLSVGGFRTVTVPTESVAVDYSFSGVGNHSSVTFTTPADCVWILVCFKNNLQTYDDATDIQLELGSTATAYEPYDQPQTASVENLLAVGNYKDTQEIISGIKTGKIGVKVLNGTENWTAYQTSSVVAVLQNATSAWGAVAGAGGYCTHLTVLQAGETTFAGSCRFATDFNIYEYKTAFGVENLAGFKAKLAAQYAAGTPVIVVYPLATETSESVTPQLSHDGSYTTVTAVGEVDDIPVTLTNTLHTTPAPEFPIDILCNNGIITVSSTTGTPEEILLTAGAQTQTATASNLLAAGTYKDEQDIITGIITRKCAICVYDGTQPISDVYFSSTGGKDIGATIIYPLETPVSEQVTAQPLQLAEGTNTISVTANIDNIDFKVEYYQPNE